MHYEDWLSEAFGVRLGAPLRPPRRRGKRGPPRCPRRDGERRDIWRLRCAFEEFLRRPPCNRLPPMPPPDARAALAAWVREYIHCVQKVVAGFPPQSRSMGVAKRAVRYANKLLSS